MKERLYNILRGSFLINDDSFKYWKSILFVLFLAIIMIASSHSADKKVYDIARLNEQVKALRSEMIDGRTILMKLKMETAIMKKMAQKGLKPSSIPPKKIKVKSQN